MKKDFYPFMQSLAQLEKKHGISVKEIFVTDQNETYSSKVKFKRSATRNEEVPLFGKYNKKRYKNGLSFKQVNR